MKEAYCSYKVSELLKKKGFDTFLPFGFNSTWHTPKPRKFIEDDGRGGFYDDKEDWISCPTHQMANAWLRKKHGLHASACILKDSSNDADGNEVDRWTYWSYDIMSVYDGTFIYQEYEKIDAEQYQSHDAAIEAALKYVLENLI